MYKRLIIISFFIGLATTLFYYVLSTRPKQKVQASGNVVFTFNGLPPNAPVFNELDFKPGDCYSRDVVVQNNNNYAVPIAVKSENILNSDNLGSILDFKITENSVSLYQDLLNQFFVATNASIDGLPLSTLAANSSTTYTFSACMASSIGNQWQQKTIVFDLVFGRTGPTPTHRPSDTPTPTPIPVPPECSLLAGKIQRVIYGTADPDRIHGSIYNDLIYGLGGDDFLDSSGGDDCIVGGDGNDIIDAEDGHDIAVGGLGNDDLRLGSGDDIAYGNEGDDLITMGSGNDLVYAGDGNDNIDLGTGTDTLYAGEGDDTALGKSDNDVMYGEAGIDNFAGGSGTDSCFSAEVRDSCEIF